MFQKNYAKYYELFNQDKPYKKEIDFVYRWADKPKRVLDLGVGTAHYWDFWPDNVSIIGMEKSTDMISRSRYGALIHQGEIMEGDFPSNNFDLATAIFDVINYIPEHDWWINLPIKKGGYFIFDIFNKEKVDKDGFRETFKRFGNVSRKIKPLIYDGKSVNLQIDVYDNGMIFQEHHKMFIYSDEDIANFCGKDFIIIDTKSTKNWQKWYKLKKQ